MPHLKISGVSKEKIIEFSSNLTNIISNTSNTSIDYIKIFYNPIEYISGKEKNIIIVEIYWMPRPQEICDKLAMEITNFFKTKGYDFIQVNYSEFPGNLFYENGIYY